MNDARIESAKSPDDWRRVPRFSVLDPAGEPPGSVLPTVYVTDELLVDTVAADPGALDHLRALAESAGWTVEIGDGEGSLEDTWTDPRTGEALPRSRGASRSVRLRLRVSADEGRIAATPDAWALLRQARRNDWGKAGLSLNHVLTTDPLGLNPFKANPFKANPFKANPFKANAATVGIDSYATVGFGGLQPVTYLGSEPSPRHPDATPPIVAVFDTGIGKHPWLEGVVVEPRLSSGEPIGLAPDGATDPEEQPSRAEPLDGIFDDAAGHGTFIAGIIRQECPDARILAVRIADGEGVILENDVIGALGRLVAFIDDTALEQRRGGSRVAVLNMSFSYFHETPDDPNTVSELRRLLDEIRARACVVVCSAGNEATSRPTYPAAIASNDPNRHVSVGALNPSDHSTALFSNVGAWVEVFAPGVSLVSTLPVAFEGGLQAGTRNDRDGRRRETLDVDDFRGGFGVWSGTSFAAPVVAGRIAAGMVAGRSPEEAKQAVKAALAVRDRSLEG